MTTWWGVQTGMLVVMGLVLLLRVFGYKEVQSGFQDRCKKSRVEARES